VNITLCYIKYYPLNNFLLLIIYNYSEKSYILFKVQDLEQGLNDPKHDQIHPQNVLVSFSETQTRQN